MGRDCSPWAELTGRKVRLIVLEEESGEPYPGIPLEERPSTAASLLKYAGTWEGNDLEECLRLVYATRSKFYIDLWIAAVALRHGLIIVSPDGDFVRMSEAKPLVLERWQTP